MFEPEPGRERFTSAQFFAFGFAATAGQVLLLRLGIILGGGNELVLGAFFGAWFMGIAVGAAAGRRRAWGPGSFRPLAALFPLLLFLNGLTVMALAGWWAPATGHIPSLGRGMLMAAALVALPGAGIGLSFPAGAAAAGGVARLFLLESAGSCVGGILASLFLLRFNPLGMLAVFGAAGLALLPGRVRFLSLVAGLGLWASWAPLVELRLHAFHPVGSVVEEADSPYQHILVTEQEGQFAVYLNGRNAGQFPVPELMMRYRPFAALGCGVPRKGTGVLIGGIPGTEEEVQSACQFGELIVLQPDAALVQALKRLRERRKGGGGQSVQHTSQEELDRIRIVSMDPRRFFADRSAGGCAVLIDLPAPASVHENRVFTVEAFRQIGRHRPAEAVVAVYLTASENYWGPEVAGQVASLYQSMKEAFSDVVAVAGPVSAIVASRTPGRLAGKIEEIEMGRIGAGGRHGWEDSVSATIAPNLFSHERREAFTRQLERVPGPLNTDDRPFGFLNSLAVREKQEGGFAIAATVMALSPWALPVLALAFLPYFPRRRRPLFQVFSAGVLGIGTFLLLSIRYQSAHGTYYGSVGLLTGLFMLGLAVSAPLAKRMATRSLAPWIPDAAALVFLGLLLVIPTGPGWLFGVLFVIAGIVAGLAFVIQGIRSGDDPAAAAAMELHDHLGAALGALATGLLLMPLLGMSGAVLALAGMKTLSLLLNLRPNPA